MQRPAAYDTPGLLPHMGERDFAALPEAQRIFPPLRPVADGRVAGAPGRNEMDPPPVRIGCNEPE